MAHNGKMPASLARLADVHLDKIQFLEIEYNEWDGARNPWSYWAWLRPGWSLDGERHCIHEPTVKKFMIMWRQVRPCECEQCVEAILEGEAKA